MAFTKITEDLNIIQALVDEPTPDGGLTPAQLKAKFDKAGNDLKDAFNNLVDELSTSTFNSGAKSIGAGIIYDGDSSDGTVQAKLEHLKTMIDNITLGEIPDNSLTKAKLNSDYANTLAEKDGTLQADLNAEKLGGESLAEVIAHTTYVVGTYTGNDSTKDVNLGFTPVAVVVISREIGKSALAVTGSDARGIAFAASQSILHIISNGFEAYYAGGYGLSNNGQVYNYIAFK